MQYDTRPLPGDKGDKMLLPLESLGQRILICGASSTGKSTLALAIGRKLGLPVVHLDQLRHLPHTDWVERPDDEFKALHDAAILRESWVMEGNYSMLMGPRLERATGIIFLTDRALANFGRYLRRTLFQKGERAGSLAGGKDTIKWEMAHWVLLRAPKRARDTRSRLVETGLPFVEFSSMREQQQAYAAWGLQR
jgi:adenylate kinase family enzyme